jgi:uroporphyrinogen decarboxylase
MTKKERVLNALLHKEGDRIPKGEAWIEGSLANRLLNKNYPLDYQHFERDSEVRKLLNMDLINLGDWPSEEIGVDEKGNKIFHSLYGYEFAFSGKSKHIIKPPIENIEEADRYMMPDIKKVSGKIISEFSKNTDLFVMGQIGGPVSMLDEMFPMEDYLVYCLTNTKEMKIIGEKVMEFEIAKAKLFLDSGADAIFFADDIAFNSGALLPPHIMEEIVYPFYSYAVKEIKKYKNVPIIFHSDGDLRKVMDKIVESGFDGIQSLQPSASMDIAQIKKEYGDVLCLMGNIDLDYIMTFATPKEVEDVVKRTIDIAAPGGGFILSTCNTFIDAIKPENAMAMYQTGHTYGDYNEATRCPTSR